MLSSSPNGSGRNQVLKVGYVLKRFPRLTETFILNEILELERQGVNLEIFSLLPPKDEPRHALISNIKAPIHYLPGHKAMKGLALTSLASTSRSERAGAIDVKLAEPIGLAASLAEADAPFDDLMPGKKPYDGALLTLRASIIGMLARSRGVQHLHAHFGSDATTAALLAGRLARLPFSFTAHARDIYHTYVTPEADARMRRAKLTEAEFVVTVSEYNRRHLIDLAGEDVGRRIVRIYNGVDVELFSPASADARDERLILSVGRLVEKKGLIDLVAACARLRNQDVAFRCTIVGEGPLRDDLQRAITAADLCGVVNLAGALPQEQVIDLMARASAMVLPCVVAASGDRDGLPTVLLEALACGLPAISTNVAGISEIINDGRNGFLVPPHDPSAIAAAIENLFKHADLRASFGRAGRAKAKSCFDLAQNVETLRRLFDLSAGAAAYGTKGDADAHRLY